MRIFARGFYEDVPKLVFLVENPQQEHFDPCPGLFLVAVQACREYLCVVEHHKVAVVEVVDYFFEYAVLNLAGLAMQDHHARFVALWRGYWAISSSGSRNLNCDNFISVISFLLVLSLVPVPAA